MEADLASQSGVQLILGDGLEEGAPLIGPGIRRIIGHVQRLRGHGYLVDLLPGPLEVGTAGWDHPHLGIGVAIPLLHRQVLGDGIIQGGRAAHPLSPAEGGLHSPFILGDGEESRNHAGQGEEGKQTEDDPYGDVGGRDYVEEGWFHGDSCTTIRGNRVEGSPKLGFGPSAIACPCDRELNWVRCASHGLAGAPDPGCSPACLVALVSEIRTGSALRPPVSLLRHIKWRLRDPPPDAGSPGACSHSRKALVESEPPRRFKSYWADAGRTRKPEFSGSGQRSFGSGGRI